MADENDIASGFETREREQAIQSHAERMARIKPAEDCRLCGIELAEHRQPWGSCITCATREEQRAKGFAR